jgi:hypothetical protein
MTHELDLKALALRPRTTSYLTLAPMQTAVVQIFVPDEARFMAPYAWTVTALDEHRFSRPLQLRAVKIRDIHQELISDEDPPGVGLSTHHLDGSGTARSVGWACFDSFENGLRITLRNPWPFPVTARVRVWGELMWEGACKP